MAAQVQPPPPEQNQLENLDVFKIKGRDKQGRRILRITGKFFPGFLSHSLSMKLIFCRFFWPLSLNVLKKHLYVFLTMICFCFLAFFMDEIKFFSLSSARTVHLNVLKKHLEFSVICSDLIFLLWSAFIYFFFFFFFIKLNFRREAYVDLPYYALIRFSCSVLFLFSCSWLCLRSICIFALLCSD